LWPRRQAVAVVARRKEPANGSTGARADQSATERVPSRSSPQHRRRREQNKVGIQRKRPFKQSRILSVDQREKRGWLCEIYGPIRCLYSPPSSLCRSSSAHRRRHRPCRNQGFRVTSNPLKAHTSAVPKPRIASGILIAV